MKIKLKDIEINYELSGNPDAPVVAMSHSLGASLGMWTPQIDVQLDRYYLLRIDTRGHGQTSAPVGPYTMDMLVEDAISLLDALDIDKVHWVGLSMGGMIGQGLALEAGDRLISLSLCDTMSVIREETKEMWKNRIVSGQRFGMQNLVDFAMERWFTESYRNSGSKIYDEIRKQFLSTPVNGYVGCCNAIYRLDYEEQLSKISTPTHIIVGDQDLATPIAESEVMHERINGSSLEIIPGAAHLSNIEQADKFNTSLLSFLNSQ